MSLDEPPTALTKVEDRRTANLIRGLPKNVDRGPDGKLRRKGFKEEVLSEQTDDMLVAMRHVFTRPATSDRTFQHKNLRRSLDANATAFYDRMADLEKAAAAKTLPNSWPAVEWDGTGICPCCRRPPGEVDDGRDLASDEVERLIQDLLDSGNKEYA